MNCFLPAQNLKIITRAIHAMSRLPGEDLFIDASNDGLSLRTVNSSHSGYISFLFKPEFFIHWAPASVQTVQNQETERDKNDEDRTTGNYCKVSMKSALILCKAVVMLEKTIESCSISINVDDWQLVFELQCKRGVIRKYKLFLLNCARMRVQFEKAQMKNIIAVPGKLFSDGVHYNFAANQEEVTMVCEDCGVSFRNYVDDTPDPEKLLKTQLQLERDEFEHYRLNSGTDITFCLKELRAFLSFVEIYQLSVVVRFNQPGQPIIFSLESDPTFVADLVLASFVEANPPNGSFENPPQQHQHSSQPTEPQLPPSQPQQLSQPHSQPQQFSQRHSQLHVNIIQKEVLSEQSRPSLFRNWSQSTGGSVASQNAGQSDDHTGEKRILAPDSDLEDY